jgi:hypothetical protein
MIDARMIGGSGRHQILSGFLDSTTNALETTPQFASDLIVE